MSHATGRRGEELAAAFLRDRGYLVLDRNYRFRRNEIDLIGVDRSAEGGATVVFVEVKTRAGEGFGAPEEAVTEQKRRAIVRVATAYLHERKMTGSRCRFDVISVRLGKEAPLVTHWRDAFRAG